MKLQQEIVEARSKWGKASSDDVFVTLCGLVAEVGELSDSIRAKYAYHKPDKPESDKSSLKHEFADVMIFLAALASKCDIDLESAVQSKILINNTRFGASR